MNKLIFKFENHSFEVTEVEEGLYDLNHLRKQVDSLEHQKWCSKNTNEMARWTRLLSEEIKTTYQLKSSRGRNAKTLANKVGLVAYTSWLNTGFRLALEEAFVAISEGRDQDAREIVGESLIDLDFAKRVDERWKVYVKWSYESFSEVNNKYGANLTRMVIRSATGASTKNNIKGKVDAGLVNRLVEQNNGAAILAINATLDIVRNAMKTSIFKTMMKTRDGQKEVYKTLAELLNWSEEGSYE
jgi:hypothetical protein